MGSSRVAAEGGATVLHAISRSLCSAEDTERITHYATLDAIRLFAAARTDYTFSALTPFRSPGLLKTSLINEATGREIPSNFDRPYLICQTPSLLIAKARVASPHQAHSRRLR